MLIMLLGKSQNARGLTKVSGWVITLVTLQWFWTHLLSQYCLDIPFIIMLRILFILSLLHETGVSVPQEPVDIFSEISGSTLETAIAIFSQSVYVHMTQNLKSDNFAFSPLCLHSCLSMLYLGTTDGSRLPSCPGGKVFWIFSAKILNWLRSISSPK